MSSLEDYCIGQEIGKGGFANVYKCRDRVTNKLYAIKIMGKHQVSSDGMTERVKSEIKIHSKMNHCSIVKLVTHFEDNNNFYIVLELCSGGNLFKFLKSFGGKPMSEVDAGIIIIQILDALQYMHGNGT